MKMPKEPEWLAAASSGRPIGVDRENKIIRGYVVAELGPFKTPGRGQFTAESLQKIVALYGEKPSGLKSRFSHPNMSSDGLGKFLGRSKGAYIDGKMVRADLHLDESSFNTPSGNLGAYVMDLAESDPDALSSSLVLQTEKIYTLDDKGRPAKDANGDDLPPVWMPTKLHASDVVDTGDAANGFLSVELREGELPDAAVRYASQVLDTLFAGETRDVVQARALAFVDRYLTNRYGPELKRQPTDAEREEIKRDYARLQRQREREAGK